jgi:hypothetical protein
MPTMVIQVRPLSNETRRPIGSVSGKKCRAIDRLTIATGGAAASSAAVNSRPLSSVMPMVWK